MSRPMCICGFRPAAINYKKDGRVFYRKRCETCIRHGGIAHGFPKWYLDGYRQKDYCEKCNYKSKYKEQFNVFHIDGNLNNSRPAITPVAPAVAAARTSSHEFDEPSNKPIDS